MTHPATSAIPGGTAPADPREDFDDGDIAIVGMAARLPGAQSIDAYWHNLSHGVRSIRELTQAELLASGEAPHLIERPDYVPFAAPLDDFAHFDAEFFGLSPKDAAIMDPQHRQFLECAWEAMENAAHVPGPGTGPVGVFAGCGMGSYFYVNVMSNPDLVDQTGTFLLRHTGNDKDFLSTRLSHIFDLRGPSLNIQTACSTSLVATHTAAQSLLNGECDMALAGGVTIEMPQARGYIYKEGEILSPDGECHAFDHRAQGTVFGSGVGVVVLRRMADAVRDGDHIWAVIRGSAINNDGADKAGYLAPSVGGQAACIAQAQAVAGITADTVDYVECHGTGTYLGDPIEVAALTEAFARTSDRLDHCRIGSVKTNIGHLDTAAGAASLIKASLALHHGQMPPSLGYEAPNPAIPFDGSPFSVNDRLTPWPETDHPARAGVNSLGVGGTNAHVVLQKAPGRGASADSDWPFQIFTLSGRSRAALDANGAALAEHLRTTDQPLADVAFTLQQGRKHFERRRVVVAETGAEAARLLVENDPRRVFTHTAMADPKPVFMFPGGGAQYAGMARDLYETEPVFADWMDRGLAILAPMLDYDIRALWLPENGQEDAADAALQKPSVQLPLIMIAEYALAQLWRAWGVQPTALIGHSMGENTAACLAGVLSFEDCIGLIHLRGTLFDAVPAGGMLSVALPADALRPYLGETLDLAAINAPQLSVATGPQAALDTLALRLTADDIDHQRIPIDIAAHSRMLEPILARFGDYLRGIPLSPPQIPLISNRSGTWMTDAEATSPDYWVAHLRGTVNFEGGLGTLACDPARLYIEVGPGKALASLAGQHGTVTANQVIGSLRHPQDPVADDAYFAAQLGRVWATGGTFDWDQIWGDGPRHRVPLPTYQFQRSRYFIEARAPEARAAHWLMRTPDREDWHWLPAWRPAYAACDVDVTGDLSETARETWLVFACDTGLSDAATARLRAAGHSVVTVRPGDAFAQTGPDDFRIAPERGRESYDQLIRQLAAEDRLPTRIVHGWLLTADEAHRPGSSFFHRVQEHGFWSLFHLAQAWSAEGAGTPHITVLTSDAMQVRSEALRYPEKATVMGPARVIPREFPGMTVAVLDLSVPLRRRAAVDVGPLLEDLLSPPANGVAAIRSGKRFALGVKQAPLPEAVLDLPQGSVVLLTGGFGGIGQTVAEALIRDHGARIALVARQALPPRDGWDAALARLAPTGSTARRIMAVRRLEAAGGTVMTLAADVSNIEEMTAAKASIEAELGPVRGLVHAAGVIDDAPILAKQSASIEDVFTPKIHGTQVLDALFPDGTLDWMALFSSTSTVTAPAGQVDYVAANEYLNAFAKARVGGKTRVVAIDWGLWSDVGMAADAMETRTGVAETPPVPIQAMMLDSAGFDATGARRFTAAYAQDRWFVDEHRTAAGVALVPGTGFLELAAEALAAQQEALPFAIEDLHFLRPCRVDAAGTQVSVTLARSDEGYDLRIESGPPGMGTEVNAEGRLALLPMPQPARLDIAAITARMETPETGDLRSPQEAHLTFGPRWRVLHSRAHARGPVPTEGLAHLRLPPAAQADAAILHPALMDLATGWAMGLIDGYDGAHLWVPVSYGTVRVFAPLGPEIVSHVRNAAANSAAHATASFDVTLAAADGTVLVEIEDFTIRKMQGAVRFAAPSAAPPAGPRPLSPAEERLRHNLTQGIPPADGAALFLRAVAAGQSQVFLTSLPLDALVAQGDAADTVSEAQTFERPQLDSDYVEPANDIERRLAGFWQELLGVEKVGVEDSFFDLGGHSLIAVRLFAMVKRAYAVDFPISILFEAPTIRACAALIADRGVATDDATSGKAPDVPPRRFTHLVPMHSGEGGPKTPFFLVAGMFGNVLNLRHLAHLLGADRPFYGLQARGLYGDAAPHADLEQAATDMIAEMRQVQPHGPYMVGGFSGGGITAYDIARQLTAQGEDIAALVMLDTPLPQRRPLSREDRMTIQWQELRAGGVGYPFRWLANRVRWEIAKRRPRAETAPDGAFHDIAIEAAFYAAIARYAVRPWEGPLTLLRPPQSGKWEVAPGRWVSSERAYVLPDNDWTGSAPRIEVIEVPGTHDSMVLEPNVRVLAARMKKVIETGERAARRRAALAAADAWAGDRAAQ